MNDRIKLIGFKTHAKARLIGEAMARDPLIKPRLHDVLQYSGYFRFRVAHRAFWEHSIRFELTYQEGIFQLADREAKCRGAISSDSMLNWDVWYNNVVHPIKTVVWQTWEKSVNLENRYLEALVDSGSATPSDVQRLINHTGCESEDGGDAVVASYKKTPTTFMSQVLGWYRNVAAI